MRGQPGGQRDYPVAAVPGPDQQPRPQDDDPVSERCTCRQFAGLFQRPIAFRFGQNLRPIRKGLGAERDQIGLGRRWNRAGFGQVRLVKPVMN